MNIYICGKITGLDPVETRKKFDDAETLIQLSGDRPFNPMRIINAEGLDYEEIMHICFSILDLCDAILILPDAKDSKGCERELRYTEEMMEKHYKLITLEELVEQLVNANEVNIPEGGCNNGVCEISE